jgi:hypothetical protein
MRPCSRRSAAIVLSLFLLWGKSQHLIAQVLFEKTDTLRVNENGIPLKNAWAGGINFVQASALDANYDGKKDLLIFDRSGNKATVYLNAGIPDSSNYTVASSYRNQLPAMHDWALLADYNNDGKEDIFTYSVGAFSVYKNTGSATAGLSFSLQKFKVYSQYNADYLPLYVTSVDIPAISDVDNDGDLDILTFSVNGTYIEYHKNQSMELFGVPDSLNSFYLETACWGNFKEDFSNCALTLDVPCFQRPASEQNLAQPQHAGSATTALDLDGDGDKDVLLGDISCNSISAITNGGSITAAQGTSQDASFPSGNFPVNLSIFPAAYHVDVNNDGKRDLLVSPNVSNASQNYSSLWMYKNVGADNHPNFKKQTELFLVKEMIDVGTGAKPVFEDLDNDGLNDLLISNDFYYNSNGSFVSSFAFYKNTGTVAQPVFSLVTKDLDSLSQLGIMSASPAFGDLNGDGNRDLIIGGEDGRLVMLINQPQGGMAHFVNPQLFYQGIDVGNLAAPQLIDIDADGLLDVIIGERNGNVNYYRNTGSSSAPAFTLVTANWGNVSTAPYQQGSITFGYSKPRVFAVGSKRYLLCGSGKGYLYLYKDLELPAFTLVDSMYQNIWEGTDAFPAIADITQDGFPDLVLGNTSGGLTFFRGLFDPSSAPSLPSRQHPFYPNPAENILYCNEPNSIKHLVIFDLTGKKVMECSDREIATGISLSGLVPGYYLLQTDNGQIRSTFPLVKR